MPLQTVTTVTVRPEGQADFLAGIAELAHAAVERDEAWRWTAHRVRVGDAQRMHFASRADSFEEIADRGPLDELWTRVLGDSKGLDRFAAVNRCIQGAENAISIDRPDLSYTEPDLRMQDHPFALVTEARARPGHAETCEELLRKVAEAIPKIDDPARMITYQTMIGELGTYYTVRPLRSIADLDRQLPTPDLLNQAFGGAEGGLIWRTGVEAVELARRQIVEFVPELSNPPHD